MQRIIYKNGNGGITVLCPSPHWKGTMKELAVKDVPAGKAYKIVNTSEISSDRTFRDAWETEDIPVTITTSMPKAINITKERLRLERKPLLELQDIRFMQAQEAGIDTAAIVTEKQRLRDITNNADKATTLDELKALKVAL